jgi:DNA-binding Lrp family transcriptional regulator
LTAYVLIQTEPFGPPVAEKIRMIPGVMLAEDVAGPYDAIALARSVSSVDLVQEVVESIRRLPGVTRAIVAPLNGQESGEREPARIVAA